MIINNKKSIPDQVFETILEQIASGSIKSGDKMPSEHELCDMFGVSRPSIKTAMDRLKLLGVIEQKVGDGTYVKAFNITELLNIYSQFALRPNTESNMDLYALKRAIVTEACCLAAENADADDLAMLKKLVEGFPSKTEQMVLEQFKELEHNFFLSLCHIGGNKYLTQLYHIAKTSLGVGQRADDQLKIKQDLSYLESIYIGIQAKDLIKCFQSIRLLLDEF